MSEVPVIVEVDEGVAVVTLNRPERRNALDRALFGGLPQVLAELDDDPAVRAIVLTGADPAFCAGLDLVELASGKLLTDLVMDHRGILPPVGKPMIGAINGPAATGGLEVALSCDWLVASERARFADTHGRVGIMPGGGITVRLSRWIGVARAKQMSLTGAYIDAPTALAWGLVNHVVPHEHLLPTARRIATEVAALEPDATRTLLDMYDAQIDAADDAAWDIERDTSRQWASRVDIADIGQRRQSIVETGSRSASR